MKKSSLCTSDGINKVFFSFLFSFFCEGFCYWPTFTIIHVHLFPQFLQALASASQLCFWTYSRLQSLAALLKATLPLFPRLYPYPMTGQVRIERPSSLDLIQDHSERRFCPWVPNRIEWVLLPRPSPASFIPSQMLIPSAPPGNFLHLRDCFPRGNWPMNIFRELSF